MVTPPDVWSLRRHQRYDLAHMRGGSHQMRGRFRRFSRPAIIALLAAAVATSRPPAAGPVIGLSYNADLAAIGFPSPVLRATVNGQAVWFLVDTGASVHT